MRLIAYGEVRFLTGEATLFARFATEEGAAFDLPLSEEQFAVLVTGVTGPPAGGGNAPPARGRAAPSLEEEDDVQVVDPRFSVGARSDQADDL